VSTPGIQPSPPPAAPRSGLPKSGQRGKKATPGLEPQAGNRRQIAVTSFDLLNGSYLTTSRGRLASIVLLSIILFAVLGLGLTGLRSNLELANVNAEIATLKERQRTATSRFVATTGLPVGVSEKQLFARFEDLTNRFEKISVLNVDSLGLYSRLVAPNVFITSLNAEIKTFKEGDKRTPTQEQLYKGIGELEPNEVLIEVSFTGVGTNPSVLTAWAQRVRDSNIFLNIVVVRSGNIYTITGVFVQDDAPPATLNAFARAGLPIALGGRETSSEGAVTGGNANGAAANSGNPAGPGDTTPQQTTPGATR